MDDIYASLGRKQIALEALDAEYSKLLDLLSRVVSGEIEKERVSVDLKDRTWVLCPAIPIRVPLQ